MGWDICNGIVSLPPNFVLNLFCCFPFFSFGSGGLILYYVLCIKRPRCAPASGRGRDVRGGAGALHFNG
jgi:hypothetical protein